MTRSIPEEVVDQIKERVNIIDVVSDYLPLKKAGINYKGLCPFHSEKTPSFTVNEEKQIFHCFGCGAGGNVITFLMKAGGMTFPEAVVDLAKKAGIAITKHEGASTDKDSKLEALYKVNDAAASFYSGLLNRSDRARDYLKKRGLEEGIANEYRLGYGGDGWDSLFRFLSQKRYPLAIAEELGLIIPKKSGGYYDRFRERLIFPIVDIQGRVIGFGGRSLDGSEPKYLNSSDSVVFKKSESLYGLYAAKRWIKDADEALIVEGYMDLLSLHQAGIKNSVATLGTALTSGHLRLIRRFTGNIATVFDADQAGLKATLRSLDLFLAEGLKGRVLSMPEGHDPDTYVKEVGAAGFRKKLKSALPLMEFYIRSVSKGRDTNKVGEKLKIFEEISPYLSRLSSRIEQAHYIKILSEMTGTREELLAEELRKKGGGAHERYDVRFNRITPLPEMPRAEKNVTCLLLRFPELRGEVEESGVIDDFQDEKLKSFAKKVLLAAAAADPLAYLESEDEKGLYSRLMVESHETVDPGKELTDSIKSLRMNKLKKEKERLRKEMEEAVRKGDEGLLMELRERHKGLK